MQFVFTLGWGSWPHFVNVGFLDDVLWLTLSLHPLVCVSKRVSFVFRGSHRSDYLTQVFFYIAVSPAVSLLHFVIMPFYLLLFIIY